MKNMRKRMISVVSAAAMVLGSVVFTGTAAEVKLSPRASVLQSVGDGYLRGITGVPTADFITAQFDGDVTVKAPDGTVLTGEALVPSDGVVSSADADVAKVLVMGDVDRDAKVNLADVTAMLKYIAKWSVDVCETAADVLADNAVNLNDVTLMLKYIAKWDIEISSPENVKVIEHNMPFFRVVSNNADFDEAFIESFAKVTGITLETIDELPDTPRPEKHIVIGNDLCDRFDFIDKDAAQAAAAHKAYIDVYDGNIYIVANNAEGVKYAADVITDTYKNGYLEIPRGYAGPITHMTESSRLYWDACDRIKNTAPVTDGSNGMSEDIYIAISNEKFTEPKNIIYMIGDGMGKNIAIGTELARQKDLYGGKLAMNYLPVEGRQSTYSTSDQVTDSAAGGTALATGYKTSNGTIAMDHDDNLAYTTLLELAAQKGMSTGIVATKAVTDATPASFTAHVEDRSYQTEIAGQQLSKLIDGTLDLILGGGYTYYDDGANSGARAAAKEQGVTYTKSWDEAYGASLPLAGLFAPEEIYTEDDDAVPHIAAMTELAIDLLSEDENGFFLMVEGSKIDSYGHLNYFAEEVQETFAFDCAVAVALRYVALNPDTVLVITADHETGGLTIGENPTAQTVKGKARYSTTGHYWVDVPVYAVGYGTEALAGNQENTDVAIFLAGLMGEEDFGEKSEVKALVDMKDKDALASIVDSLEKGKEAVKITDDGLRVDFGNGITHVYIPSEYFETDSEELKNVTAVRVTYTNMSDTSELVPTFAFRHGKSTSATGDRMTYIAPGETLTYTYVISAGARHEGKLSTADDIVLYTRAGGDVDVVISDISVVTRDLLK